MATRHYEKHDERSVTLPVSAAQAFAYSDDFSRLSFHMNQSSSMMMGGKMQTRVDQAHGQAVGSRVRMTGTMMGVTISLEEVVTERDPPSHEAWETIGDPRLLVIDHYRLGFDIIPSGAFCKLRVFIDYNLPTAPPLRWLGLLFGGIHARWCVQQMANGAVAFFSNESFY
jgi:hypothetical protein